MLTKVRETFDGLLLGIQRLARKHLPVSIATSINNRIMIIRDNL